MVLIMPLCLAIASGRSLFAAGVASRLRQYLPEVELKLIDLRQADAPRQIASVQPTVVILDVTDPEVVELLPLQQLLKVQPSLKIIHLDPQQAEIQVITSQQHVAAEVQDLVRMIKEFV